MEQSLFHVDRSAVEVGIFGQEARVEESLVPDQDGMAQEEVA